MKRCLWLIVAGLTLMLPASAHAAFPGTNGRIALASPEHTNCCNLSIYTVKPDGSDLVRLTTDLFENTDPAWSPNGQKIAFSSTRDNPGETPHIWIMDADGSNPVQVTNDPNRTDFEPAWSPDGSKIVFNGLAIGVSNDIYTVDANGSNEFNLTASPPGAVDGEPAWSPDGQLIAFSSTRDGFAGTDIYTMAPDGSQVTRLTETEDVELQPNWSPDGAKLVFFRGVAGQVADQNELFIINRDGTGPVQITNDTDDNTDPVWAPAGDRIAYTNSPNGSGLELHLIDPDGSNEVDISPDSHLTHKPDWQPIPVNSYARPKGATPFRASLATAYKPCAAPNRTHGPPLAFPSCNPPQQASDFLTVGTADANARPALNEGYVRFDVIVGNPATAVDDADVKIELFSDDVFTKSGLADYAGSLRAEFVVRITDRDNSTAAGAPGAGTTTEIPLGVTFPCAPVADPQEGASCSATVSLDTLIPQVVKEGKRAIWQIDRVRVFDGGADGHGNTTNDNTLFATQGVFIP